MEKISDEDIGVSEKSKKTMPRFLNRTTRIVIISLLIGGVLGFFLGIISAVMINSASENQQFQEDGLSSCLSSIVDLPNDSSEETMDAFMDDCFEKYPLL